MDERDEDSGSDSEDEYSSSGSDSDSDEDSSSESDSEDGAADPEHDEADAYLERIGAQDHYDEITSQINPSEDPSLLNEDNKHYYTARALGVRRGMREGELNSGDAFDQLSGVISGQLTDIGAREPAYGLDDTLDPGTGGTDHNPDGTSSIQLPSADFAGGTLDSETVDSLYHESVHAEQWSLASDVRDGTNDDPSDRAARLAGEWDPADEDIRGRIQDAPADTYLGGDAYQRLPTEQEAFQAARDVKAMYENVGAMHDELEARTAGTREQLDAEAEDRAIDVAERTADWQENPLYEPEGGWQNNPLYQEPQGAQ